MPLLCACCVVRSEQRVEGAARRHARAGLRPSFAPGGKRKHRGCADKAGAEAEPEAVEAVAPKRRGRLLQRLGGVRQRLDGDVQREHRGDARKRLADGGRRRACGEVDAGVLSVAVIKWPGRPAGAAAQRAAVRRRTRGGGAAATSLQRLLLEVAAHERKVVRGAQLTRGPQCAADASFGATREEGQDDWPRRAR